MHCARVTGIRGNTSDEGRAILENTAARVTEGPYPAGLADRFPRQIIDVVLESLDDDKAEGTVVIGLAGMSYGMLMAHSRAFLPAHLTGRGVTLMNFFSIGGVGLLQFLAPTGQFLLSIAVFGEPFSRAHGAAFALIWAGLVLYVLDLRRRQRRAARIAAAAV